MEPWEITQAEYMETATIMRVGPEQSYAEWAHQHGYPVPLDDHALFTPRWTSAIQSIFDARELSMRLYYMRIGQALYNEKVASGEIPIVTHYIVPNADQESSLAALRVQHKRSIRGALRQGKPVPPKVLADYSELTN